MSGWDLDCGDVEDTLASIQPPPAHTYPNTHPPIPSLPNTHTHTHLKLSTSHKGHLPRDGGDAGDVALHVRLHTLDSIQPPTHTLPNTYPPPFHPPPPISAPPLPFLLLLPHFPTRAHTYLRLSTSHEGHLPRDGGDAALHVRLEPKMQDAEHTLASSHTPTLHSPPATKAMSPETMVMLVM